jgi:Domain of unknown function (DUF4263)
MQYLAHYHKHLSSLLSAVPTQPDVREKIANTPCPSLAIGPVELWVCKDGFIVLFKNRQGSNFSVALRPSVDKPVSEVFDQVSKYTHTFVNPISHFQITGHSIKLGPSFSCPPKTLITMVFENLPHFDIMTPLCSKLLIFGYEFADQFIDNDLPNESENLAPSELAQSHFKQAHYNINVGGRDRGARLLREFNSILRQKEHVLQVFLRKHPEFICPDFTESRSQPHFGGERKPDFAISTQDYGGFRWIFVEIERPNKRIFTRGKEFQFTKDLTQAEGQILEWEAIITKDHAYFEKRYSGLYKPQFLLVFGRDQELDEQRRDRLRTRFAGSNKDFCTFDDLARRFERILSNFGKYAPIS